MADFDQLQALLAGMRTPQTPAAQPPVTATTPFNNLQTLFSGGDITPVVRSIGGGMANMVETNDPYLAFGRAFGGAQNQSQTAAQTAAEAAAKAKQDEFDNAMALNNALINQETNQSRMGQDQSQFDQRMTQDQTQFEQQQELRRAQEARQQKMDDLQIKKTDAELKRMADSNGLSVNQMLEIERIAQAEGEGYISTSERKAAVDAKRNELLSQFTTGGVKTNNAETPTNAPAVGDVVDGYVFQGGDPAKPESWTQQ
jgi:hypothetical protein